MYTMLMYSSFSVLSLCILWLLFTLTTERAKCSAMALREAGTDENTERGRGWLRMGKSPQKDSVASQHARSPAGFAIGRQSASRRASSADDGFNDDLMPELDDGVLPGALDATDAAGAADASVAERSGTHSQRQSSINASNSTSNATAPSDVFQSRHDAESNAMGAPHNVDNASEAEHEVVMHESTQQGQGFKQLQNEYDPRKDFAQDSNTKNDDQPAAQEGLTDDSELPKDNESIDVECFNHQAVTDHVHGKHASHEDGHPGGREEHEMSNGVGDQQNENPDLQQEQIHNEVGEATEAAVTGKHGYAQADDRMHSKEHAEEEERSIAFGENPMKCTSEAGVRATRPCGAAFDQTDLVVGREDTDDAHKEDRGYVQKQPAVARPRRSSAPSMGAANAQDEPSRDRQRPSVNIPLRTPKESDHESGVCHRYVSDTTSAKRVDNNVIQSDQEITDSALDPQKDQDQEHSSPPKQAALQRSEDPPGAPVTQKRKRLMGNTPEKSCKAAKTLQMSQTNEESRPELSSMGDANQYNTNFSLQPLADRDADQLATEEEQDVSHVDTPGEQHKTAREQSTNEVTDSNVHFEEVEQSHAHDGLDSNAKLKSTSEGREATAGNKRGANSSRGINVKVSRSSSDSQRSQRQVQEASLSPKSAKNSDTFPPPPPRNSRTQASSKGISVSSRSQQEQDEQQQRRQHISQVDHEFSRKGRMLEHTDGGATWNVGHSIDPQKQQGEQSTGNKSDERERGEQQETISEGIHKELQRQISITSSLKEHHATSAQKLDKVRKRNV